MRSAPFDVERSLHVPPGFSISVYARISGARFLAVAPNGDLLVSEPDAGKVSLVRPDPDGGDPLVSDFVTGLRKPHDIVFHAVDDVTYVYIAESHQINRYVYNDGDTTAQEREIIIGDLPDSSSPELRGAHGHELKNIALDANHKLYLSNASATNADVSDTTSDPVRGAIYQYDADGANGRLFAQGLRNAEGLAMLPGTDQLWVAVNGRDNVRYPFDDETGWYGQVVPEYVDNHPPDAFTRVRDGGNYGWPFANPNPDSGLDDMPFDPDFENNPDGTVVDVSTFDRMTKGIPAHSAPLGLLFLHETAFPGSYRDGAVVALHGSWNRTESIGFTVAYFPWDGTTQAPGQQMDLVTGWADDTSQYPWGRPVDVAVDLAGDLLISDDHSGTIYRLSYNPPPSEEAARSPRINADTALSVTGFDLPPYEAVLNFAGLGKPPKE